MAASVDLKTALPSPNESASTLSLAVDPVRPRAAMFASKNYRIASAVASVASVALIILGVSVLIGWAFDIGVLKSIAPDMPTMKPNTAVCFVLAGLSLWLLRREGVSGPRLRWGQVCATVVIVIGALTLVEFLFKLNLHVDSLLFATATSAAGPFPGRMSFATALSLVLLGNALLFINEKSKGKTLTDVLAGSAAALTLLTFLAFLYKVEALQRLLPFSGSALHTIIGLFVLCVGLLFARAKDGFVAVFLSDTAGGMVARRLLPVAILIPPVLGWFRLIGERRG